MRRWIMLGLGTAAQTAACAFVYGVPYLADELRGREGLTLTQVGVLVACPTVGLVLALYAWGAAADRWGERVVIAAGLGGAAGALSVAAWWA
ncbi:MAG: MFS transporter, partial [Streptomyces sp.]|nr:MFS transporter [Streptomyces sp.]